MQPTSCFVHLPTMTDLPSNGIIKRPGCPPAVGVQTPKDIFENSFFLQTYFCLSMPKNISLNVEESLFPKVSLLEQLSCPFVLIARKEFLCFNYKKIPGKNFFCPSRRFVHCNKSGGSVSAVMGLLQQSKSKSILLSAWADTETSLSTVNTTVLCPSTSWHWNITMQRKTVTLYR